MTRSAAKRASDTEPPKHLDADADESLDTLARLAHPCRCLREARHRGRSHRQPNQLPREVEPIGAVTLACASERQAPLSGWDGD